MKGEQAARAWLAWHTAMLGRMKSPPPLKDLLPGRPSPPPRAKTAQELEAIARAWAQAS